MLACPDALRKSLAVLDSRNSYNIKKVKVVSPKTKSAYFSVSRTKSRFRSTDTTYIILLSVPS